MSERANCEAEERCFLLEFALGKLRGNGNERVEKHLTGCKYCRDSLEFIKRFIHDFRILGKIECQKHIADEEIIDLAEKYPNLLDLSDKPRVEPEEIQKAALHFLFCTECRDVFAWMVELDRNLAANLQED
jgi:predicted anti-sigma-YlaC factor YlaD